jgi:hypothetical protein
MSNVLEMFPAPMASLRHTEYSTRLRQLTKRFCVYRPGHSALHVPGWIADRETLVGDWLAVSQDIEAAMDAVTVKEENAA